MQVTGDLIGWSRHPHGSSVDNRLLTHAIVYLSRIPGIHDWYMSHVELTAVTRDDCQPVMECRYGNNQVRL